MNIKPLWTFGATVYLKSDVEQLPCIVVALYLEPNGTIRYVVNCNGEESSHHYFELTDKRDMELIAIYKDE